MQTIPGDCLSRQLMSHEGIRWQDRPGLISPACTLSLIIKITLVQISSGFASARWQPLTTRFWWWRIGCRKGLWCRKYYRPHLGYSCMGPVVLYSIDLSEASKASGFLSIKGNCYFFSLVNPLFWGYRINLIVDGEFGAIRYSLCWSGRCRFLEQMEVFQANVNRAGVFLSYSLIVQDRCVLPESICWKIANLTYGSDAFSCLM